MDRTALFVDAGYLLACGTQLTLNDVKAKRKQCSVKIAWLAHDLQELAKESSGLPLLRTYWYDGSWQGKRSLEHSQVLEASLVKLRLGKNTISGQKGVDSLVFRDLTTLARERAICSAFLVAGDEDMREAVSMVQDLGVQVTLITVVPVPDQKFENTSQGLMDEVDAVEALERDWIVKYFEPRLDMNTNSQAMVARGGDDPQSAHVKA